MKLLRLLLVPFALLCVIALRLLKGRVRIGALQVNRIGHLAGNVEVYLCERDDGIRTSKDIWFTSGDVCNDQLLKMWRRVITIDRTGFVEIVSKVNQLFNNPKLIEIPVGNIDRDVNNLLEEYPSHLSFTENEELRGKVGLFHLGIPQGAKFVCLIVRDSAYLPELGYHSYRDSDIDSYMEAAKALADRGYYVIRMGAKVAKPIPVNLSTKAPYRFDHIVDYATNGMRSDFMDIYLAAKCEFAISTSTGLDAVCSAFRRPICYVNFVPLEYLPTWSKWPAIWKHHWKDGKRMSPKEIWESGAGQFMRADQFAEAGITLVDNTPEEIRDVVMEMADMQGSTHSMDPVAEGNPGRQRMFWVDFPRSTSPYTKTPLHGEIRMRIGREFLKGYTPVDFNPYAVSVIQ